MYKAKIYYKLIVLIEEEVEEVQYVDSQNKLKQQVYIYLQQKLFNKDNKDKLIIKWKSLMKMVKSSKNCLSSEVVTEKTDVQ